MVWVVLFALLGGLMVSYTRARAEGLGVQLRWSACCSGRSAIVLLGFGSIFGSLVEHMTEWHVFGAPYGLVVCTVLLLAVFSNLTAVQRVDLRQLGTLHEQAHE